MNHSIPSYTWTRQASGKAPYTCTVDIGGIQYIGQAGRSKKEAEIKASWAALLAIKGFFFLFRGTFLYNHCIRCSNCIDFFLPYAGFACMELFYAGQLEGHANGTTKYIIVPGKRRGNEAESKPIETLKPHEVKKGGIKKKWNKMKFMNRNSQSIDVEKNEARASGDVSSVISPGSPQSTQESSSDIVMLKHDDDASKAVEEPGCDSVMMQPNKEARRAELEPDNAKPDKQARRAEPEPDIAMLNPDQENTRVQQVQGSGTAMLQPDNEARRVEQVPGSDTVMLQLHKDARRVEKEPPRDFGMVRPTEEAGCINEKLGETVMPQHVRAARTN
jgi:hypothetical protein